MTEIPDSDDFDVIDDSVAQEKRAERNALEQLAKKKFARLADDLEVARAQMSREAMIAVSIRDAVTKGDTAAWEELSNHLSKAMRDEEIIALAYACFLSIPADLAVWLVRDLFQIQPFPFSSPKAAQKEMLADARAWVKSCSAVQKKAYATAIVQAMSRKDRQALHKWMEGL